MDIFKNDYSFIIENIKTIYFNEKDDINRFAFSILQNSTIIYQKMNEFQIFQEYNKNQVKIIWNELTRRLKYYNKIVINSIKTGNYSKLFKTLNHFKRINENNSFKFLYQLVDNNQLYELFSFLLSPENINFILQTNKKQSQFINPNIFSLENVGFKIIYQLKGNFINKQFISQEIKISITRWLNNLNSNKPIFNYWEFLNLLQYKNLTEGDIEKEELVKQQLGITNCIEPFLWKNDQMNPETKQKCNTLINKNKSILTSIIIPESFQNYSISSRQYVFADKPLLTEIPFLCFPKYFVPLSILTKSEKRTEWNPILNNLFLKCSFGENRFGNQLPSIFSVRFYIPKDSNIDFIPYFQSQSSKFVGLLNLVIPSKTQFGFKFYPITIYLFLENNVLTAYNLDGNRIDFYESIYKPQLKFLWRELYYFRNLEKEGKAFFYQYVGNYYPSQTHNLIFISQYSPQQIIYKYPNFKPITIQSGYPQMFIINPLNNIQIGGNKYICFDKKYLDFEKLAKIYKKRSEIKNLYFMSSHYLLNPQDSPTYANKKEFNKIYKTEKKRIGKSNDFLYYDFIKLSGDEDKSILLSKFKLRHNLTDYEVIYRLLKNNILEKNKKIGIVAKSIGFIEALSLLKLKNVNQFFPEFELNNKSVFENQLAFIKKVNKNYKFERLDFTNSKKENFNILLIDIFPKSENCLIRNSLEMIKNLLFYLTHFIPNKLDDNGSCFFRFIYSPNSFFTDLFSLLSICFEDYEFINLDFESTFHFPFVLFKNFNSKKLIDIIKDFDLKNKFEKIKNIKTDDICTLCQTELFSLKNQNEIKINMNSNLDFLSINSNQNNFIKSFVEYQNSLLTRYLSFITLQEEKLKKCGLNDLKKRQECFNQYFNDTLEQSLLYATKYNLPIKPWFKEQGAFKTEYGLYVLSKLFSMDENYALQLRNTDFSIPKIELKKYSSQELSLWNELSTTNDKFDNLARNIDFLDMDIWYKNNRNFRLYEKRLSETLLKDYGIGILTNKTETTHGGKRPVSRAWLKLFEVLNEFPFKFQEKKNKDNKIKAFHICEAPGNFIKATEFFLERGKLNHDWKAQSLVESDISDEYGIVKETLEKWDFGPYQDGDITQADNIKHYYKEFKDKNIQFMTADCGVEQAESNLTLKLHFSEILTILLCLSKGGSFVSKLYFPLVDPAIIQMIYLVSTQFEKVYLYKSYQNPWNTEVYLAAIGYKKTLKPESGLASLFDYQQELEREKKNNNEDKQLLFINPKDIPEEFMRQLNYFTEKLYKIFEEAILRQFYYYDHYKELEQLKEKAMMEKAIKDANEDWINRYIKN